MRRRHALLILAPLLSAPGAGRAQSVIQGIAISGHGVALEIEQVGRSSIGEAGAPLAAAGESLALSLSQHGQDNRITGAVRAADAARGGAPASRVRVEQRQENGSPVARAEARLLIGLAGAATGQDIAILQRGDGAYAEVQAASGGAVHGLTLGLRQDQGASARIDIQSGVGSAIAWSQGVGAQGSLVSNGDGLRASITQAPGSRVDINNNGSNNAYSVATQQAADRLTLGVTGSNNSFNFDFQGYREVAWRNAVTNGGSYSVSGGVVVDQNSRVMGAAAVMTR